MGFYPYWPPVAAFVLLLGLAATPLLEAMVRLPGSAAQRSRGIDGLRGFLALSVVMLHGAIYHRYITDGLWSGPPSPLYTVLGTGGVAVFFMITGYLFWGKLLDERGRIDWVRLYVGRLFRIAPLYLVMVALMLFLVMEQAGWQVLVTPMQLAKQIAPWLALGLLDPTDVNGHVATLVLSAGVTWSLRYEWLFYLSLPLLACVAGPGRPRTTLLLIAVATGFWWSVRGHPYFLNAGDPAYATLFLIGGACAALHRIRPALAVGNRICSALVVDAAGAGDRGDRAADLEDRPAPPAGSAAAADTMTNRPARLRLPAGP